MTTLGIYDDVPRAAFNRVVERGATPEEEARRLGLVRRLDVYEMTFAMAYLAAPDAPVGLVHGRAMFDAGLTDEGLCNARFFAGKKASYKPGIFFPERG